MDLRGGGDVAQGELMRFFAEAAWYPTALLPSQGVRREAVDDRYARATLVDAMLSVTLLFRFNDLGLIESARAEARGRTVGRAIIMTPWEGRWWDYQERDGMRVTLGRRVGRSDRQPAGRSSTTARPDSRHPTSQPARVECSFIVRGTAMKIVAAVVGSILLIGLGGLTAYVEAEGPLRHESPGDAGRARALVLHHPSRDAGFSDDLSMALAQGLKSAGLAVERATLTSATPVRPMGYALVAVTSNAY